VRGEAEVAVRAALDLHHIVHTLVEVGGPLYTVPSLCRELSAAGHRVWLHVLDPVPDGPYDDLQIRRYARQRWSSRLDASPSMRHGLAAAAAGGDILHTHGLWRMPYVYPRRAVRGRLCRLVMSPRGTLDPWAFAHRYWRKQVFWRTVQRRALAAADCIHVTARQEHDYVRELGFRNPIALIPNGVDIPALPARPSKARDVRCLLFLARIHPKKGVDRLLHAWSRVEGRFPEWRLRVVGEDNGHLEAMRALARSLRLERADLVGYVPENQKWAEYLAADLYVLPTHNENWGVSIADALAYGVPAIVGRGAPWKELGSRGCGWWIDNTPEAIAECLEKALALPRAELEAMGQRGRVWVGSAFGWPAVAEQTEALYRWLIEGGTPPECILTD
jgi:glycosyltransferase involved in cell wall biosynthesis